MGDAGPQPKIGYPGRHHHPRRLHMRSRHPRAGRSAGRSVAVRGFVRADVCLGVALWRLSVSAVVCPVVSVSGVVLSWVEILGGMTSVTFRMTVGDFRKRLRFGP